MTWDPQLYHRFQSERAAPFIDTAALVRPRPAMRVVDLGCGTGELTRRLADMLPGCDALGLDSSPQMLAKAEQHARPGLRFEQGDLRSLAGEWDLIFSHAALHWADDHPALLRALLARLRPGGQLVAQMPSNHGHLAQRTIVAVAGEEPFRTALGGWSRTSPVLPVDQYAELLYALGAHEITVLEKVYPHVLADADALVEWTRGTTILPYLERLPEDVGHAFLERYRARMRELMPQAPLFYGFRRTIIAASAPEPAAQTA